MYTVFLSGGIASGKSTVANELVRLGASTIDLDQVSREVVRPGTPTLAALADAFGSDVIDPPTGELNRGLLAQRAFGTASGTRKLEEIEIPAITDAFLRELKVLSDKGATVCLVQIPLLDRVEALFPLADEIICVVSPIELRRSRAIKRGMTGEDFDARITHQPSDDYFRSHATTVFDNSGSRDQLISQVDSWWARHERDRWCEVRP